MSPLQSHVRLKKSFNSLLGLFVSLEPRIRDSITDAARTHREFPGREVYRSRRGLGRRLTSTFTTRFRPSTLRSIPLQVTGPLLTFTWEIMLLCRKSRRPGGPLRGSFGTITFKKVKILIRSASAMRVVYSPRRWPRRTRSALKGTELTASSSLTAKSHQLLIQGCLPRIKRERDSKSNNPGNNYHSTALKIAIPI